MSENAKRLIEVAAIMLGGLWMIFMVYHSLDGRVTQAEGRTNVMESRITAAESRVDQESKGYLVLQGELAKRLDRLEGKLDAMIEQRRGR